MPTIEPALFTRVILITFDETVRTEETKKLFNELTQMESQGLSHISSSFLQHREIFETQYKEVFREVKKEVFKLVNIPEIDDRMIDNIAAILSVAKITLNNSLVNFPFTYGKFRDFAINNLKNQYAILISSDDVSKFWQIVEHLFNTNVISEPKHFMLKDGFIFLRVQHLYPLYVREMVAQKDPNILSKETLDNYLKTDRRFSKHVKKQFGDQFTWCMSFLYADLGIDLIRDADPNMLARKYVEMGVQTEISKPDPELQYVNQVEPDKAPF
jgi:DNA-directed RNA polymerase subunit F